MSSHVVTQAWEIEGETEDFAKEIRDDIDRFLPGIRINGSDILWAAYQHSGKTRGGLIVPQSFQRESGIQGIVGLIVKTGPQLGKDQELVNHFGGQVPQEGQWAVIDTRYGIKFILGGGRGKEGRHIRIVEAKMIYALIDRPDWVI